METGIADPMELIACPFDPVHMVQRKRMQYHIMKCQKNMDMRRFRKCPFNAQHIVLVEEYEEHVRTCEGRAVVEREMVYHREMRNPDTAQARGNLDVPQSNWVVPESTENWDDDDFTVVVGSSRTPAAPPHRPTERPREPAKARLPLRGQSEGSKVFEYSVGASDVTRKPVAGRGRGRGRGLINHISSRPGRQHDVLPPREPSPSTSEAPTESESSVSVTAEEKRAKDIRKLKKMLRQIEKIEQKQSEGVELNPDQLDKLARRDDVVASLRLLEGEEGH